MDNPVTDIVTLACETQTKVLELAAAAESGSGHPLAKAILSRASADGISIPSAKDAKVIVGNGVTALVGKSHTWVSSPRYAQSQEVLDQRGLSHVIGLEDEGKTVVVVHDKDEAIGLIALRDEPRADAAEAARQLKELGIRATMLTGDNSRTASAIAAKLDLDFRAEMMPADKLNAIREFASHGGVMMIGDGINDAPALKQASVGVAMGSGTDVALESADAAILRNRVSDVPALIRLARATMGNIRQNVSLALGLKVVFLATSIMGMTGHRCDSTGDCECASTPSSGSDTLAEQTLMSELKRGGLSQVHRRATVPTHMPMN